jgi:hypothetical protein
MSPTVYFPPTAAPILPWPAAHLFMASSTRPVGLALRMAFSLRDHASEWERLRITALYYGG